MRKFCFVKSPLNFDLFSTGEVKMINRHGEHIFDRVFYSLISSGSVGLTRQQQRIHRLKKAHWYYVLPCTPNSPPMSIASIFDQELKYRKRAGGLDDVFEMIFGNVLLSRFYP